MSEANDTDAPEGADPLKAVEAKREARKAQARKAYEARLAVDLDAIDELEIQLGDSNVAVVRLSGLVSDDLPAAVACRCPKPVDIKRFRDEVTPTKDHRNREVPADREAACERLARVCLVYPDKDTFARLCEARPGIAVQLGGEAVKLAVGVEESEGKG